MKRFGLLLCIGVLLAGSMACSRLRVESDPPGARVVWSPDGLEPYRAWPPNSWELTSSSREGITPFRSSGSYRDTIFITVEKEGYMRPKPELAQLFGFRGEHFRFELRKTPEAYAAEMREQGMLLYRGEWVDPEEAGVAEFEGVVMPAEEAFRLRQRARGLVEFEGEWMTPEEAEAAETELRTAEGFVRFKDRWVTPEVREMELGIDEEVAAIGEETIYQDLPAPRVIGRALIQGAQLQLYNSTGQVVRMLFSGPISREYEIGPYRSVGVRSDDRIILPAGRYDIAIIPSGLDGSGRDLTALAERLGGDAADALSTDPLWGSWPLATGTQVSFNFAGSREGLQDTIDQLDVPVPEFDIEAPEIEIPEFEPRNSRPRPPGGGGPGGGGGRGQQ